MPACQTKLPTVDSLFTARDVLCHVEDKDASALLFKMLQRLAERHAVGDIETKHRQLMAREHSQGLLIRPGIAMPHVRVPGLTRTVVCVATSKPGIPFRQAGVQESEKGQAHVIVLIATSQQDPSSHLQALSALAKVLREPGTAERIAALETAEAVHRFFAEKSVQLPEHVRVGDIMSRQVVTLRDTDTLQKAIDQFVRHRTAELPVVDGEGNMVGVASALELLRTCLPEYLLWADDLDCVSHFEPFGEVLRHESRIMLTDIETREYAAVQEDALAIEAAVEVVKRGARTVYVLRGKKLVGILTLEHFVDVVMRE